MPMWRCPHCGTPQAETARCWVCRRSTTACGTCRHFRRSVAGEHRLLRPRPSARSRSLGDEIRACWEARPGARWPRRSRRRATRLPVVDGAPVQHDRVRRGRPPAPAARPTDRAVATERDGRRRARTIARRSRPTSPVEPLGGPDRLGPRSIAGPGGRRIRRRRRRRGRGRCRRRGRRRGRASVSGSGSASGSASGSGSVSASGSGSGVGSAWARALRDDVVDRRLLGDDHARRRALAR